MYNETIFGGIGMKKLLLACLVFTLLLTGCTKEDKTDTTQDVNKNFSSGMDTNQIVKGNFSSVAGTYTNPNGDKMQLDEDGLRWNERQTSAIHCSNYGICTMGIHVAGQGDGGYTLTIYPEGIHVPGLSTDIEKVRICYGQAEPMSEDEIYTFSSDKVDPLIIESEYQAFITKEYYDVLFELSSPYGLFNPHIEKNLLTINGVDISVEFYDDVNFYNLTLTKELKYAKGEPKRAELILSVSCDQNQELSYNGKLVTNDGQSFLITYDEINQTIINNKESSDSFGQTIQFVESLHSQLIDCFEDAKRITEQHYPVLSTWKQQLNEVRNNRKDYNEIVHARDIEIPAKIASELLSQAFMDKHYDEVLLQCFRDDLYAADYLLREYSCAIQIEDRSVTYHSNGSYILQLDEQIYYTKDDGGKNALLELTALRTPGLQANYEAVLHIYYGDTFYLRYDPVNQILLDNESGSKTYGQPTKFVSSLNQKLIAVFKKVQTTTELQYPVLSEWMNEAASVRQGKKEASAIKDAYDIELNLEVLDIEFETSMADFIMTDPCASAIELVKCYLYQVQKASSLSKLESLNSYESIFWATLNMVGFEGNEHFPYQDLIRRNDNALYVFTLEDMQQYSYELYGYEFDAYLPSEWSSMYKPALKRYESWLEFGIHGEAPGTFRAENLRAEQNENQIIVTFDVVWFEVDDNWEPAEVIKVQPSTSEYQLMNENGHTFLRHVATNFGEQQ